MLSKPNSTVDDNWEGLLLDGPVMNDAQYRVFEENRQKFDQWRES